MTPSELLNDNIAINKDFTDVYGMVAADLVVWDTLVLTLVTISVQFAF